MLSVIVDEVWRGVRKMALIYIVEDDQNIREIESFALKNSGYQVQGFECAKDFYHQLAEKTPCCRMKMDWR